MGTSQRAMCYPRKWDEKEERGFGGSFIPWEVSEVLKGSLMGH